MKKLLRNMLALLVSLALSATLVMVGSVESWAETGVNLSGTSFSFTDIRTGKIETFNANDGKVNLIVYGGIGSCFNTGTTIETINQLAKKVDSSKISIYLIDIKDNSNTTIKNFLANKNISSNIKVCSLNESVGGSKFRSLQNKCKTYYGIGGFVMPFLLYKNSSGLIYNYSTNVAAGSDIKSNLAKVGIEVNSISDGNISNYVMNVTYGQTEARGMLSMVNSFRTGSEAWYYNSENAKINLSGLSTLTYDYDLEKVAMLRAAEIAYYYSHTRPNGMDCITAYGEKGYSSSAFGENIAYGFDSASSVFDAWKESNEDYNGQGHRRNMLSSSYSTIAVGHVVYEGVHYWVQEFGNRKQNVSATGANNGSASVTIQVNSNVQKNNFSSGYNANGNNCTIWDHSGYESLAVEVENKTAYSHTIREDWQCHDCYGRGTSTKTEPHTYSESKVVKEPTATTKGQKQLICSKCKYSVLEDIPALGNTPSNPTVSPSPVNPINPVGPSTPVKPTIVDPGQTSSVRGFVSRLYSLVLGREADMLGLLDWTNRLLIGEITGAEAARGFFMSDEMTNRGLSNEEFVKICYKTMLSREADQGGLNDWVGKLNNGVSRLRVLAGFTDSAEFGNICSQSGITRGELTSTLGIDRSGAENFVARCYTKALGRDAEAAGLNDWTNRIVNREWTAEDVATTGFFCSQEFANKNTSNEEYVAILYRTFLGREYDQAGFDDWVGQLRAGVDRNDVLHGFSRSAEFANIMAQYGL